MLLGKITCDEGNYIVKVGRVSIDITKDVHALIDRERALLAGKIDRYNQIAKIILASDVALPTG